MLKRSGSHPAKHYRNLREAILDAIEGVGSDGKGRDGAKGYLTDMAKNHRADFVRLLALVCPQRTEN